MVTGRTCPQGVPGWCGVHARPNAYQVGSKSMPGVSEAALQIRVWPCHNRSPWILASGAKIWYYHWPYRRAVVPKESGRRRRRSGRRRPRRRGGITTTGPRGMVGRVEVVLEFAKVRIGVQKTAALKRYQNSQSSNGSAEHGIIGAGPTFAKSDRNAKTVL
jgi:hypothetical protein